LNSKGKYPIDPLFHDHPNKVINLEDTYKILILGAGNQGKSVLFEQLKHLVLNQRGERTGIVESENAKDQVIHFAVENLKVLLALSVNKQPQEFHYLLLNQWMH
jgi:GTPase SAR1 family protein